MSYDPRTAGALCGQCPLNGKRVVPPKGNMRTHLVICGEAPGAQEEKKGEPFIGPSGMLLNKLLGKHGLKRSDVWLTNAVLCRPDVPGIQGSKRFDMKTYLAWIKLQNRARRKQGREYWKDWDEETMGPRPKFEEWIAPHLMPSPFACCAPRLRRELEYFEVVAQYAGAPNGAVVIPMGAYAAQTITGKKVGIMKLRGSPVPVDVSKIGGGT